MRTLQIESLGESKGGDLALVHGWGHGQAVWQPISAALAQRFRVHLLTLPGYGDSEPDAGPDSSDFPGFEWTTQALIDRLPRGTSLCAWSLGSLLALHAALLAPQHFSRLILVAATPCFAQRADWHCAQSPALLDAFAAAVATDASPTLQRFVALLNQGDERARANNRGMAALAAAPPTGAALAQGLSWLREIDLRQKLQSAALALPTLLIHGRRDSLIPLAAAQWLHKVLPKSRLDIFESAAHAPFFNDPARFVELLDDFCNAPTAD